MKPERREFVFVAPRDCADGGGDDGGYVTIVGEDWARCNIGARKIVLSSKGKAITQQWARKSPEFRGSGNTL